MTRDPRSARPATSAAATDFGKAVVRRRRLAMAGLALGFGGLGAGLSWWRLRPGTALEKAVELLLDANLADPSGQPAALARFRDRPLVINFWATWCAPCVKEMPELSRLRDEFAPRGLETLGIAIDAPSAVRAFVARQPVSYPVVIGGMGGTELASAFGNGSGALPFTVVLAPDARLVWRHLGAVEPGALRAACERALRA